MVSLHLATLTSLSQNLQELGYPVKSKLSVVSMWCFIVRISFLVQALSVIQMKSDNSGEYISSYFDAMSMAVTPTSYKYFLSMSGYSSRYLSIVLMVKKSVSGISLNFRCTSMSQSISMPRIFSSICYYLVIQFILIKGFLLSCLTMFLQQSSAYSLTN